MTNVPATAAAQPPAAPKEPINVGGPIAALVPQNIEQAFRLSTALAQSGDMVPKQFQGKPNEIMAAIMRGMEVGLAPLQALSCIAVINGRASIWGDALPALVQRAGHHVDVEIEGEGDKMVATATLTRSDGRKVVRRFSMADAKRAGLSGKQGPWTQYPQRMISARARAWAIRDGASDALMGMQVAEEVSDYGPDHARDITPETPRRGGAIYRAPAPAPVVDEIEEGAAEEADSAPPVLDEETRQRIEAEAMAAAAEKAREVEGDAT